MKIFENLDVKEYQKFWQKFPDSGNCDVKITRTKHFDIKIYQICQNSGKKGRKFFILVSDPNSDRIIRIIVIRLKTVTIEVSQFHRCLLGNEKAIIGCPQGGGWLVLSLCCPPLVWIIGCGTEGYTFVTFISHWFLRLRA